MFVSQLKYDFYFINSNGENFLLHEPTSQRKKSPKGQWLGRNRSDSWFSRVLWFWECKDQISLNGGKIYLFSCFRLCLYSIVPTVLWGRMSKGLTNDYILLVTVSMVMGGLTWLMTVLGAKEDHPRSNLRASSKGGMGWESMSDGGGGLLWK